MGGRAARMPCLIWKEMRQRDFVSEIAAKEKINPSYVSRVLRLTLLTPAIVEAILDGRRPPELGVNG